MVNRLAAWLVPALELGAVAALATHYPPRSTNINNLTYALSGTGAPGIFNTSTTPDKQYGAYNWCNMPHARTKEYITPAKEYQLLYVEVIQRHHKRTPYASNTFFKEGIKWSCDGQGPVYGARNLKGSGSDAIPVQWQAFTDVQNPFTQTVGPGFPASTCQFPQITSEGLQDAFVHGSDLREVYARRLDLDSEYDSDKVTIRVTNNVITSQVASGLLHGLFPDNDLDELTVPVKVQSSSFDSLEPTISCNKANTLRTGYTTGSGGAPWQDHLQKAKPLFGRLDVVSGIDPGDSGWHVSFDHYYDNMSAKQCHAKPLPCSVNDTALCISQDDANTVYRLGNWEYSWIFRDAPNSAAYAALRYGPWMLELKAHLQGVVNGSNKIKYFHNIAHDGSMSALLGFLQIDQMVWPGMGSEVIFELYSQNVKAKPSQQQDQNQKAYFVRVLWGGQPMSTSTPLGKLDMIPLERFTAYVDSMLGGDLVAQCSAS